MEQLPKDKILEFNKDTLLTVRKKYGLDKPERMKESLDLLEEWVKCQNHFLKKNFSRGYLERMLISAKGSVEKTKERLDRVCTLRLLMPQYFETHEKNYFDYYSDKINLAVLPKMTSKHERIFLCTHYGNEFTASMFLDTFKFCVMIAEYILAHDYAIGNHIVLDYRTCIFAELLANFSVFDLRQLCTVLIEGYGFRVKGIHMIADFKFVDIMLMITKQVLPKKISERIHLHKNDISLHEHLEKDVLPIEYGGKEKSMTELNADWIKTLYSKESLDYWKEMSLARTDESRRKTENFNEQYLGMPGSFRTLSVD